MRPQERASSEAMTACRRSRWIGRAARLLWLLPTALGSAWAGDAGGHRTYPLDWHAPGEVLLYHTCGCADACWVAEVRVERTKVLKARLQCDCEMLHFKRPSAKPKVLGSCEAINTSDQKMDVIADQLKQLLRAP